MPELPEVRTVVKHLNKYMENKKIIDCDFLVEKMVKGSTIEKFKKEILKLKVKNVSNHGKFILFHLEKNKVILSHLRMEGKYRFTNELSLGKHDHAWFKFQKGYLIYNDVRKFGTFELKTNQNVYTSRPLDKLGELPRDISENELFIKLSKKSIAIKTALLDQTIILGLGNIYVDEVLFKSNILPTRKSNTITKKEVKTIIDAAIKIMKKATAEGGSSIRTYKAFGQVVGNYQNYLMVHTKKGEPCKVCGTPIKKTKVNGRGTYYCPKCQK